MPGPLTGQSGHPGVAAFCEALASGPQTPGVFNPWGQSDHAHGIGPEGPRIRRRQLEHYLAARLGPARWILIGEALGYQGGHFSGLAMTSERILLGHKADDGIPPGQVLPGLTPRRTSDPDLKPAGFSEPTATIVWGTLLPWGIEGREFVLWNAFAWHPFVPAAGTLSNRRPTADELASGRQQLERLLALYPRARPVAVGRVAQAQLARLGVEAAGVRHPAHGGAPQFRRAMWDLLRPD